MEVRDFMIREIITAKPTTTVKELISLLVKHRIGGVPVVDDRGNLVGIITDGDVVRFLSPHKDKIYFAYLITYIEDAQKIEDVLKEKMNTPIEKIMVKKNIKTLAPDDDFETAIRLISRHHFKKIPVLNGAGRVIGIISRGDVIHAIAQMIPEDEAEIESFSTIP